MRKAILTLKNHKLKFPLVCLQLVTFEPIKIILHIAFKVVQNKW